MSVLDRAIIKAYRKGTSSPQESPRDGAEEVRRAEEVEEHDDAVWDEDIAPAVYPEGFGFDDTVFRVDPCHPDQLSQGLRPHAQFAPPGGFADLAYVSPYHGLAEAPSAELTEEPVEATDSEAEETALRSPEPDLSVTATQEPPPTDEAKVKIAEETVSAVAVDVPEDPPEQPAQEPPELELRQSLQEAAAINLPPTLQLPSVFLAPDNEASQDSLDADGDEISPVWEVDRFAWPSICERLLETQSRYFGHVGQRLMAATEENHHVIMISGSRRGEGRTTLAMCLARCATAAGVEVALVDADLQNPELGSRLGMETPCSWLEAFSGKATLNEVAVSSVEDHLTLIPLSGSEQAYISAGDRRVISLVRKISAHFPLVIVDAGPASPQCSHLFDGAEPCPVDTAIVVRDLRHTTEKEAIATAECLQQSGIQAVGVAENFRADQ